MKKIVTLILVFVSVCGYCQTNSIGDSTNYFIVSYLYPTPDSVKMIYTEVTQYLSQFIETGIPIHVQVQWTNLDTGKVKTVEGQCDATNHFANFKNAPVKDVLYPLPLAEKLAGVELNGSNDPDIAMQVNSDSTIMHWYYKDDGKTPATMLDLYTILLHETCHGLGFNSNFSANATTKKAFFYASGKPYIFDTYVTDNKGVFIAESSLDSLQKNGQVDSAGLYKILTADSSFASSPFSQSQSDKVKPRLYAPNIFGNGGSIKHLNTTYTYGDPNFLMTPFHNYGQSEHNLGPIVKEILTMLGWSDKLISVNKVSDTEDMTHPSNILVHIDSLMNPSTLLLHYSLDNFSNQDTLPFTKTDTVGYFRSAIPSFSSFYHSVSYYVTAKDTTGFEVVGYPNSVNSFYVGKDTIKPTIAYTPFTLSSGVDSVIIKAQASDNIGIDSVWMLYSINYGKIDTIKFVSKSSSEYETKINFKSPLNENDVFSFILIATDNSLSHNYSIVNGKVTTDLTPITSLHVNFEDASEANQFNLDSFYVAKPEGFSKYCLNSPHPYPSTHISQTTLNMTATFKNRFKIDTAGGAYMYYKEVVLVEPASQGAVFQLNNDSIDNSFYDYCIVEGSKDKIKWYPFEDGYKTELHPDWQARYDSKFVTIDNRQSSAADGSEDLYHYHTINLLNNKYLRRNDTVYIRFRLFSDAYVNGWGWAIDSISIQPTYITGIEQTSENASIVSIYPTISSGNFIVHSDKSVINHCEVYSLQETLIPCQYKSGTNETFLEISAPSGLYFVRITLNNGYQITKKVLICAN